MRRLPRPAAGCRRGREQDAGRRIAAGKGASCTTRRRTFGSASRAPTRRPRGQPARCGAYQCGQGNRPAHTSGSESTRRSRSRCSPALRARPVIKERGSSHAVRRRRRRHGDDASYSRAELAGEVQERGTTPTRTPPRRRAPRRAQWRRPARRSGRRSRGAGAGRPSPSGTFAATRRLPRRRGPRRGRGGRRDRLVGDGHLVAPSVGSTALLPWVGADRRNLKRMDDEEHSAAPADPPIPGVAPPTRGFQVDQVVRRDQCGGCRRGPHGLVDPAAVLTYSPGSALDPRSRVRVRGAKTIRIPAT